MYNFYLISYNTIDLKEERYSKYGIKSFKPLIVYLANLKKNVLSTFFGKYFMKQSNMKKVS